MSADTRPTGTLPRVVATVRLDRPAGSQGAWDFSRLTCASVVEQPWRVLTLVVLAVGFVLYAGDRLELGPEEARLGLAALEPFGPLGQAFGGWEPRVWPGPLLAARAWAWGAGATQSSAVRWPAAIAGALAGIVLARRGSLALGGRSGLLIGLAWLGSLALMDRSAGAGLDLFTGLFTVAAIDRLLGKGSDLAAGSWMALSFLCGGWPPLAIVSLSTVVIGRRGSGLSWRLLLPPVAVVAGWSAWALSVMPAQAWGASMAAPFTEEPAWWLIPGVLALAMPWSPLAMLSASRTLREGWDAPGRALVVGWLQVSGCALLAGTLIPGLAVAARVPALAGLAVAAGASCAGLIERFDHSSRFARRWLFGSLVGMVGIWVVLVVLGGGYLAAAVPYYRPLAIGLIVAALPLLAMTWQALERRDPRVAVLTVLVLAVCLRAGQAGYYAPEWNYRRGQGPWGRAIGQWVPPGWPVYIVHAWPADLAFATGHPFRQIPSEWHLKHQPGAIRFVLLLKSEFDHWPANAPELVKVGAFQDEYGGTRVLARTPGDLPWVTLAKGRALRSSSENDDR